MHYVQGGDAVGAVGREGEGGGGRTDAGKKEKGGREESWSRSRTPRSRDSTN